MEITKVWALYYSATGTTDKAVNTIAEELAAQLTLPIERLSFTRPAERTGTHLFTAEDLVVVGSPTYAGRLPNKIAPDFRSGLRGEGTPAVPVVLFGNRSYDNALAELWSVLMNNGFHPVAAGAFVGRHAFTDKLGEGRPDWDDKRQMRQFAAQIAGKLKAESLITMTDIAGLLRDKDDPSSLISKINVSEAPQLMAEGVISGGMIPKVECCIEAIRRGVGKVFIIDGRIPHAILIEILTEEGIGTMFV